MSEVNQLILDCLAKVLHINQITDADIDFRLISNVDSIECFGYKNGYAATVAELGENASPDFMPINPTSCSLQNYAYEDIYFTNPDAAQKLRDLLSLLNELEKELLS